MERKHHDSRDAAAQQFATWLRDELTSRGYNLGLRGGGQARFAADSGIGAATVSRMLGGVGGTDTRVLSLLADALHLPLGEVLVKAGILDERELRAVQHPTPGPRRITPQQAADELGITDAQARRVFINMTRTLQRQPPPDAGEEHLAES